MAEEEAEKPKEMIKLVSKEGHEFSVEKQAAMVSNTIKSMLTGPGAPLRLLSPPAARRRGAAQGARGARGTDATNAQLCAFAADSYRHRRPIALWIARSLPTFRPALLRSVLSSSSAFFILPSLSTSSPRFSSSWASWMRCSSLS